MHSIYFDGKAGTPDTGRTLRYLHPLQELLARDRRDPTGPAALRASPFP